MTAISQILARRMRLVKPQTLDVVCERDLPAPMDDGAVLLADRWAPRATRGRPQPTVLVRTPYGRRQLVGMLFGRLLAERGLQAVVQSVRGTFGSEGDFTPFDERADGLATLRWLRAQPWHAGRVGTIGPSYLGFVQWAIAGEAGGDLAAMSIHVSASQFHGHTYAGDSISLENTASWMVVLSAQERRFGFVAIERALRSLRALLSELPVGDLDERATGGQVTWFRAAFANPRREDEYWATRDFSSTVAAVTAPVQFVGGWYDILLPWMLADFEALQGARRSPQLIIGPWSHTSPGLIAVAERDGIAWLRAHLLGDDRLVRPSPVRLAVTGEHTGGGWRDLPAWPPPGVGERRLYLSAAGRLADEPCADPSGTGDRYRYDPADPTPSLGGPTLFSREPVVDNAPLEARADVLTYTSAPLPATLEAIGHVRVELWVKAQRPHFDIFARVCDVGLDGVSLNVCDALAGVAPGGFEQTADGAWRVGFELWPTAHRFAAGHRIRLQVSSGAHPRYSRNPGTGENPATATAARMLAVEIEILRDGEHRSLLVLPAMP
ncbi:MAG: CocE/NonD family hydrolase [Solirubrobacteraceae bacterium]